MRLNLHGSRSPGSEAMLASLAGGVVLVSFAMLSACASIGTRPIKTQEKFIRDSTEETLVDGPGKPTAAVEGTTLKFRAVGLCQNRSVRHVEEVRTSERFMEDNYAWYMGGAGLAALTAGSIGAVDASNVYTDDATSRTYNPTGPDKAFLANGALLATGVAAGALLLVSAIRASGTEETVKPKEIAADPTGDPFPCAQKTLPNEPVVALVGQDQKPLGSTNSAGVLDVDLDDALPPIWFGNEIKLAVRGRIVLTVDVTSLQRSREEKLWRRIPLDQCRTPTASDSCKILKAFLQWFPDGSHSAEAKTILDGAQAKLARLLDDESWKAIDSACRDGHFGTSAEGATLCLPIREYLEKHPNGLHAAEARKLLAVSDQMIARLATAEKVAQKTREEDAERLEKQRALQNRKQCVSRCQLGCSGWQTRDQAACFSGCVNLQCEGE